MTAVPFDLLPEGAAVAPDGWLTIGGCRIDDLVAEHGTPLFVYDEDHLRARCREAVAAFPGGAAYATKAFLCRAMARVALDAGMHLDVATGGELHVALAAGAPPDRIVLHGNNKSTGELATALEAGVGRIVVDSFDELDRLDSLLAAAPKLATPALLVRINPGIDVHTNDKVATGVEDSKFGFSVSRGLADRALSRVAANPRFHLAGIHLHIGSQVFNADNFAEALAIAAPIVADHHLDEFVVGGGLGVAYVGGEHAPSLSAWAERIHEVCARMGITARIAAEPGRSIVARAGLTVYTVGTIKEIPGVRTYVAVDGGMSDNPRPVLYGSGYETFLPRAPLADRTRTITLVGKHCESGDRLVDRGLVPDDLAVGDLIATPVTGAYGHSMGSNYNKVLRPAVVFASNGNARVVIRRETLADLLAADIG